MMTPPPEFLAAMRQHVELAERHGEDSPEARKSFVLVLSLAPEGFIAMMFKEATEAGFLPKPSGYLADGEPVFSPSDIASHFNVTPEESDRAMAQVLADRLELGLPLDGILIDPASIHRRQ